MTPSDSVAITERKRALRREMRARRLRLDAAARAAASRAAAWHALGHLPWRERPRVALFWPLAEEIDTRPLLHALHWLGGEPLLPRMQGKGRPLVFHAWSPETPLVEGPFGVLEPGPGLPAVLPGTVLAPLLAFDRSGHRLGYGAGFYDLTFTAIAAMGGAPWRVGFCFACQEVEHVPVDAFDIPLDAVITEAGVLPLRAAPAGLS
jgi:5-formyltetrahydrofolate cyclo-ligase